MISKKLNAGNILAAIERSCADRKLAVIVKDICRMLGVSTTTDNMEIIASFITMEEKWTRK